MLTGMATGTWMILPATALGVPSATLAGFVELTWFTLDAGFIEITCFTLDAGFAEITLFTLDVVTLSEVRGDRKTAAKEQQIANAITYFFIQMLLFSGLRDIHLSPSLERDVE
jgi:hypothetical protein